MIRILWIAIGTAFAAGTLYRLYPAVAGMPDLAQFFVTEDGYLMLTVARNMAIGLGMSVSEGTIATNGVQPMATFLFSAAYLLTGGDKTAGLIGVHLIMAAAALGAAFAVRAFAARVLARQDTAAIWPWVVAGLWFTGPLLLRHTMNGLETGLYVLVLLLTLLQFARVLEQGTGAGLLSGLVLGALCGLAFLARNDAVFLVLAVFSLWSLHALFALRLGVGTVLGRIGPAAAVCGLLILPWLANNQLRFGSVVPISGTAQSSAEFGANAPMLPAILFEHLLPMLPVPGGLEESVPVIALTSVVVLAALGWFAWRVWRAGGVIRLVVLAYALHGAALIWYYGFNFGAAHFLSRYMAPLSPLLLLAAVVAVLDLARGLFGRRAEAVQTGAALLAFALTAALLGYFATPAQRNQGHFQVVDWVSANVPPETWVGAVQTGTLGYWHDRTVNLDGKVNPAALAARLREGHVLGYVVSSDIEVLADWAGIAGWAEDPRDGFSEAFTLVVSDTAQNLAVLRRSSE